MCTVCSDFFFFYTFLSTEKKGKNIQYYKTITACSASICQILLYGRHSLTRFILKEGRKSPNKGQSSAPPPSFPNRWLFDLCITILKVLKCFLSYMKYPHSCEPSCSKRLDHATVTPPSRDHPRESGFKQMWQIWWYFSIHLALKGRSTHISGRNISLSIKKKLK